MGHQSEVGFDVGPEVISQDLAMAPAPSTTDITVSIDSLGQRSVAYPPMRSTLGVTESGQAGG